MKKILKFRVWDEEVNRFYYLESIWNRPDPSFTGEVQQFTGLLDKDGQEVFEGDVIQPEAGHASFVTNDPFVIEWRPGFYRYFASCAEGKIIGNVCENPELVKQP